MATGNMYQECKGARMLQWIGVVRRGFHLNLLNQRSVKRHPTQVFVCSSCDLSSFPCTLVQTRCFMHPLLRVSGTSTCPLQPAGVWGSVLGFDTMRFHFSLHFLFPTLRLSRKYSLLYVFLVLRETRFPCWWAFQKSFQCFCKTNTFIAARNIPQKASL